MNKALMAMMVLMMASSSVFAANTGKGNGRGEQEQGKSGNQGKNEQKPSDVVRDPKTGEREKSTEVKIGGAEADVVLTKAEAADAIVTIGKRLEESTDLPEAVRVEYAKFLKSSSSDPVASLQALAKKLGKSVKDIINCKGG